MVLLFSAECSDRRVQNAARLLLVRGPPFRDPRSSSRPEGPNALDFVKRFGLVRPDMALDRAPRGLTRRCRRRFHFFVAPRSALGAFIFSAHGAPACSLLSERILSEMKQQQQQQQQPASQQPASQGSTASCKSTCTTSTPGKRRGSPPAKGGATYPEVSAAAAASRAAGHSKARSSTSASIAQVHQQQQERQQSPQTAQKA